MDEQTNQSSSARVAEDTLSKAEPDDGITARSVLLGEARTAANQQLSQLTKIDDAAVRTVRITFVVVGILVGGTRLPSFPDLGVFGALGTWTLVASLFCSLYVYGTSRLFVGPNPAELNIDYAESPTIGDTRVKVIRRYEAGIGHNWNILYVNGFVLAVSRLLLALAVLFVLFGIVQVT